MCFKTTSETIVNTPPPTAQETRLNNIYADYAENTAMPLATKASQYASNAMGNTLEPNYNAMYQQMMPAVQQQQANFANLQGYANTQPDALNAMSQAQYNQNMYGNVAQGLQNARFSYINEPLQEANKAMNSGLSALGNKGVLNSSITKNFVNDLTSDTQNTIANRLSDAYSQDFNTSAGLGQQNYTNYSNNIANAIANRSSLINQGLDLAYAPSQYAAALQQNAQTVPQSWAAMALGQAQPTYNLASNLAGQRAAAAGRTTTQDDGMGGMFGSVLGAATGKLFK